MTFVDEDRLYAGLDAVVELTQVEPEVAVQIVAWVRDEEKRQRHSFAYWMRLGLEGLL